MRAKGSAFTRSEAMRFLVKTWLLVLTLGIGMFHVIAPTMAQIDSNLPPNIILTNPPSDSIFSYPAIIRLKASASGLDGAIVEVRFYETYEETRLLGIVTQPPYNFTVTNVGGMLEQGYYYYFAAAIDNKGAIATSAPVRILIIQDVMPSQVAITQPGNGETFLTPGSFPVVATVITRDGSENPVQVYAETNLIGTIDSPPYILLVNNLTAGQHVLTARYVDNFGNMGVSQPVRINFTPLFLTRPVLASDGQFRFTIGGLVAGKSFEVQASSNLLSWFSVATNTVSFQTRFILSSQARRTAVHGFIVHGKILDGCR